MAKYKVGDYVQLRPDYYRGAWFYGFSCRSERKKIASLVGQRGRIESIGFALSPLLQEYMVRYGHDLFKIPGDLLDFSPTERLTKRPAQAGEKVKIVNAIAPAGRYKDGDVLTVEKSKPDSHCVITIGTIVLHDAEYLVIEPDQPQKHRYTEEQIAEARQITYDELFKVWRGGGCQAIHFVEMQPDDFSHQDDDDRRFKGKPRTLCTKIRSYSGAKLQRTHAFCAPNDEWTPEIGRMVAICKMTGRKLPDWL